MLYFNPQIDRNGAPRHLLKLPRTRWQLARGQTPQYQSEPQFPHLAKAGWLFPPGSTSSGEGFRKGKGHGDWLQLEPSGLQAQGTWVGEPHVLPRILGRWRLVSRQLLCLQTTGPPWTGCVLRPGCRLPPPLGSHPGGGGGESAAVNIPDPSSGERAQLLAW